MKRTSCFPLADRPDELNVSNSLLMALSCRPQRPELYFSLWIYRFSGYLCQLIHPS